MTTSVPAAQPTLTQVQLTEDLNGLLAVPQGRGPVFGTLLKITGAKPNPVDAVDAWQRIESFFGEHLASKNPR